MKKRRIKNETRFLITELSNNIKEIVLIVIMLIAVAGLNAIQPYISAALIDDGLVKGNMNFTMKYAITFFLISMTISVIYIFVEKVRLRGYNNIQMRLKQKSLDKLMHIKIVFYNERSATEIYQEIEEDVSAISGCFSSEILLSIVQVFTSIALIPVLIGISWKLTLIMFIAIPIDLLKSFFYSKIGYGISKKRVKAKKDYSKWMSDVVSGISTIRCFGLGSHFQSLFVKRQGEVYRTQYKSELFQEATMRFDSILIEIIVLILYILGGAFVARGEITLGNFIAFQTYSLGILNVIGQLLNVVYGYSIIRPSIERYLGFLGESNEESGALRVCAKEVDIKLNKVFFSYDKNCPIFNGIDLFIPHGQRVGICGKNGCGKSTLVHLLLRMIAPEQGEILINNTTANQFDVEVYRSLFSVATQKPFFFNDSIKNNICLYREVPDTIIDKTLEIVGLSRLVKEKTIDYQIGQDGCELSGGQRQRLSLARTLVSTAPIVILDEPETSLDKELYEIMTKLLNKSFNGRTVIVITHNEKILRAMDVSYVLSDSTLTKMEV